MPPSKQHEALCRNVQRRLAPGLRLWRREGRWWVVDVSAAQVSDDLAEIAASLGCRPARERT